MPDQQVQGIESRIDVDPAAQDPHATRAETLESWQDLRNRIDEWQRHMYVLHAELVEEINKAAERKRREETKPLRCP